MIVLQNVGKKFGRHSVLKDVSLRIDPGEFLCITGPSGAGKSTLLHILSSAEIQSEGSVQVDGIELTVLPRPILQLYRRKIGVVFQDYKLLPRRTVEQNIAFPLEVIGYPRPDIEKRVKELLHDMDLTKSKNSYPHELSGGEQARVAIARAVAHKPVFVFADEPTGNLDPEKSKAIMHLFKEIHKNGTTVILATHDVSLVNALHTRVVRIEDGSLTRDAHGSYTHASHTKQKETEHGKHKVFADIDDATLDTIEGSQEKKMKKSGQKVKIVPVNSREK